jgi:L-fuconolactonase
MTMTRRTVLGAPALALVAEAAAPFPIIDAHIHLYDPFRPGGAPWPPKDNAVLYKTTLPPRYRQIAAPLGIVAAIVVEASPLAADSQWVLDVAAKDPMMVATVGNLEPASADFAAQFERLRGNPMFRGIRYGNLWNRSLGASLGNPRFVEGLKLVAKAGLSMDSANATPELLQAIVRTTDKVPDLRVIIDHLPRLEMPADAAARRAVEADLREIGKRPQIFAKISGILRRVDGRVPLDLAFYKPCIDQIYETFGPDRVIYASDWPFAEQWGAYGQGFRIVREYFAAKGEAAARKYFARNSVAAYRWKPREAKQALPSG